MVIGQSSKIIGTPIKIGKLEVAQNDFPTPMIWDDAKKACADLGSGWRLPTKDELNLMYLNEDKIGGFAYNFYWSSTELYLNVAWGQDFGNGGQYGFYKIYNFNVRAVRAF
jgi:hypothetical protein